MRTNRVIERNARVAVGSMNEEENKMMEALLNKLLHLGDECAIVNAYTSLIYSGAWGKEMEIIAELPERATWEQYLAWEEELAHLECPVKEIKYDFREMKMEWYYRKTDGVYTTRYYNSKYCYGGNVAGHSRLTLQQFTLCLLAQEAEGIEMYSTLFSVETEGGKAARRRAISGAEYWQSEFDASLT